MGNNSQTSSLERKKQDHQRADSAGANKENQQAQHINEIPIESLHTANDTSYSSSVASTLNNTTFPVAQRQAMASNLSHNISNQSMQRLVNSSSVQLKKEKQPTLGNDVPGNLSGLKPEPETEPEMFDDIGHLSPSSFPITPELFIDQADIYVSRRVARSAPYYMRYHIPATQVLQMFTTALLTDADGSKEDVTTGLRELTDNFQDQERITALRAILADTSIVDRISERVIERVEAEYQYRFDLQAVTPFSLALINKCIQVINEITNPVPTPSPKKKK